MKLKISALAAFSNKEETLHWSNITRFHKLLRDSGAVNMPSNEDQYYATSECQQKDLEQL